MNDGAAQKTALVLCGGGSRGAAEVGFYKALHELGIRPDFIVGTSVGAVNGAHIAAGLEPEALRRLWLDFHKWRPFRFNWEVLWKGLGAASLLDPSGFKRFLEDTLGAKRFEDLNIPLTIVATDLQKAEPVYFDEGPLVFAVMASIALPLYFPPLLLGGRQLVDGGVTNNVPLDVAVKKGATRIYSMLCGCREELDRPVTGFLNLQSRAFQIATRQKLQWDIEHLKDKADIVVLEPCLSSAKNVLDFSRTAYIMEEAYRHAKAVLPSKLGAWRSPKTAAPREMKP